MTSNSLEARLISDEDTVVYIPDIKTAITNTFQNTPGFKQMDWKYRSDTGEFVVNDVFSKSTKEKAFLPPPACYFLISQALKKLPLFCVLNETAFDRLVSMVTMEAVAVRKRRIIREAEAAEKKAEEEARKAEEEELKSQGFVKRWSQEQKKLIWIRESE